MSHPVTVHDIHHALFPTANNQARVRNEERILDTQVFVRCVQEGPVERREPVEERSSRTDLDEAVPEIPSTHVAVERSVAGKRVQISVRIRRQSSARLPDAAQTAVRRRVVDHDLLQRRRVVAEDPPVIRALIAVRGPCDVDGAVIDEQCRALILRFAR